MTDSITLTGLVATAPRHIVTSEGLPITSFRLASTQRRFDRAAQRWIDGDTNWFTITTFRQLAINGAGSISKGDRIVVAGRLRIREWENGERTGTTVDVEAEAVGHDLAWGTSTFSRSINVAAATAPTSLDVPTEPGEPSEADGAAEVSRATEPAEGDSAAKSAEDVELEPALPF